MEIRTWFDQELVLPIDMQRSSGDMYQHSHDTLFLPPIILWGLQWGSTSGNTVAFSIGAARVADITVANYPYLPTPPYGSGYPAFIQIPAGSNSITLNPATTPCYLVATYTISPNISGQNLYTITGSLIQIATGSYNPALHVKLAQATYSLGVWTVDQTPGTHRDADSAGLLGVQWNLQNNKLTLGPPPGYSGTTITTQSGQNVVLTNNLTVQGSLFDANGFSLGPAQADVPTTATPIDSLTTIAPFLRFTGSIATTINGITAGVDGGQPLTIYNSSSVSLTFTNQSGSATGSQIKTPTGSSITLAAGYTLSFKYDINGVYWIPSLSS